MIKEKNLLKCAALLLALAFVPDTGAQRGRAQGRMQTPPRAGGSDIVAINAQGIASELSGLNPNWSYSDPVLSPDGKRLAFTGTPPSAGARGPRQQSIIVVYTLPRGPIVALDAPGQNHLASWVGKTGKISFLRRDNNRDLSDALIVRNADGTGQEEAVVDELSNTIGVAWSSDGKEFLVARQGTTTYPRGGILRYSMQNVNSPSIFETDEPMPGRLAASPDGSMIAFTAEGPRGTRGRSAASGNRRVYVVPTKGGGTQIVSISGELPAWSANGRTLFFVSMNDRRIYSARVRPGTVPRADRAAPVSVPLTQPVTQFAVLPGDSLFVMRRAPLLDAQPLPADVRGIRADSISQKQLEVLAARALAPIAADKGINLAIHVLETRAVAAAGDPVFAGFPQEVTSYLLPGRDSVHLNSLSRILGAAGWVPDNPSCPDRPSAADCRVASSTASLDFSPAVLSADSARIYIHSYRRPDPAAGITIAIVTRWSFTFLLGRGGWSLLRVE